MSNLKIVSDGTPRNTQVIDMETNKPIQGLVGVHVSITLEGSKAIIEVLNPVVEIFNIDGTIKKYAGQ